MKYTRLIFTFPRSHVDKVWNAFKMNTRTSSEQHSSYGNVANSSGNSNNRLPLLLFATIAQKYAEKHKSATEQRTKKKHARYQYVLDSHI